VGLVRGDIDVFASDPVTSKSSRVPFGVVRGRRLIDPAVFPIGPMFLSEVAAPAVQRPPTRVGALPCGIFFKDAQGVVKRRKRQPT